MIDVRQAVQSAKNYIQNLQDMLENPLDNLRLEEVEISEDESHWLITLRYDVEDRSRLPALLINQDKFTSREYKLFQVNSDSGKVEAMKIRKV